LRSSVFNGKAPTIVFYAGPASQSKLDALQKKKIMTVRMPHRDGRIQFRDVISKLRQYSLNRVLIEGGGETIASAIESGVVTEVILFIAPKIIGGRLAKTPVEGFGIANIKDSLILHEPRISRIGPDWMLIAKVNNK
jgi:diaminohydroxyphosphoribosylaminopyrimidine deaminase/5-amino-6-(5-phosphoribosylamino)uracil reductase